MRCDSGKNFSSPRTGAALLPRRDRHHETSRGSRVHEMIFRDFRDLAESRAAQGFSWHQNANERSRPRVLGEIVADVHRRLGPVCNTRIGSFTDNAR